MKTKIDEEEKITKALTKALRDVFGEHTKSQRFIDVSRIPLICKSIFDTSNKLTEINIKLDTKFVTKEAFFPVKSLVYGATSIILIAVFSAIVYLVINRGI